MSRTDVYLRKYVKDRMKAEGIDARKLLMIVSEDLVRLEIPTFCHLVLTTRNMDSGATPSAHTGTLDMRQ